MSCIHHDHRDHLPGCTGTAEFERLREEIRLLREVMTQKDGDFRRIVSHYLPTEFAHSVAASALALNTNPK